MSSKVPSHAFTSHTPAGPNAGPLRSCLCRCCVWWRLGGACGQPAGLAPCAASNPTLSRRPKTPLEARTQHSRLLQYSTKHNVTIQYSNTVLQYYTRCPQGSIPVVMHYAGLGGLGNRNTNRRIHTMVHAVHTRESTVQHGSRLLTNCP